MATVSHGRTSVKRTPTKVNSTKASRGKAAATARLVESRAALMALLNRLSDSKHEGKRDALAAGSAYRISAMIHADVDGQEVELHVATHPALTVGADYERATSTGPDAASVLAYALSMVNRATRTKILRDLPEAFAANDNELPTVADELVAETDNMLSRLRSKGTQTCKGSVAAPYILASSGEELASKIASQQANG